MTLKMKTLTAAALAIMAPTLVLAQVPLSEVKAIDGNMLSVAIAIEISDECASIDARKVKGLNFLWSLKREASKLGYSDDAIRAYVESDAEKDRIRAAGYDYARAQGVDPETSEGLCALGKMEIAKGSTIGGLLRAK